MENITNNIDLKNNISNPEQIVWPTKKPGIKKKYLVAGIFAAALVLIVAIGSFYFVRNLNLASTPNAPSSEPQAAYTSKAIKSWNGGKACEQGCGANEYCENGRCRKSGGNGDARNPQQVAAGAGTQLVNPTTVKFDPDTYVCTEDNCPSPEFYCASSNNCLPSAGYCKGKLCDGKCVGEGNEWVCEEKNYGLPSNTATGDINDCGDNHYKCAKGFQYCSKEGRCVAIPGISGVDKCDGKAPDKPGEQTCCVLPGVGTVPVEAETNYSNEIIDGDGVGDIDYRTHWTNCAEGTSCVQGKGCFGTSVKTPEKTTTEITTVTTVTTTVTATPTITVTATPTATPTATVTITVTSTPSATTTVQPTMAVCNESCEIDDDCATGLFCDSESNKCRKPECSTATSCVCPTETPEPTIVDCNKRCNSDDNCSTGLFCDSESGRCRKATCSDEKDCSCPKPRTTDAPTREITRTTTRSVAQPTVLKEAGILDFPGAAVFGSGLLLTVIGILLAL